MTTLSLGETVKLAWYQETNGPLTESYNKNLAFSNRPNLGITMNPRTTPPKYSMKSLPPKD